MLDLARVGSGAGPDVEAIAEIHDAFPELSLLAGGGVRDADDLRALEDAGRGRRARRDCAPQRRHLTTERQLLAG